MDRWARSKQTTAIAARMANLLGFALTVVACGRPPTTTQPTQENTPIGQATKWTPPKTTLPDEFVDLATFLLDHGLSNPSGGEYRHFKVVVNDLSGRSSQVPAVGWFFPGSHGQAQRVVCADGLAYTPIDVGTKADINADIAAQVALTLKKPEPQLAGISVDNLASDLGVALMLIAGQVKPAEETYANLNKIRRASDFIPIATQFLSGWYDRIVTAHMQGDVAFVFHQAVLLQKFRTDYEREAIRLLGTRAIRQMSRPDSGGNGAIDTFRFLDQLPDLVQDAARRYDQGSQKAVDYVSLAKFAPNARIDALISRFDEFQARQTRKPEQIAWMSDPIFSAIVKEGKPAIVPLLNAMDNDTRLTRAVSFVRETDPARTIVTVKNAARKAIGFILDWPGIDNIDGHPATSEQIREFLVQHGTESQADRWFGVLADDQATPQQWLNAATYLMSPSPTQPAEHPAMLGPKLPGPSAVRLNAEDVRSRKDPSLSDLLAKRAEGLVADTDQIEPGSPDVSIAIQLAILFGKWDDKAALSALERTTVVEMAQPMESLDISEPFLPKAIDLRVSLGDKKALFEYSQWLVALGGVDVSSIDTHIFEPLVSNHAAADLQGLPEKLFLGPASKLNILKLAEGEPQTMLAQRLAVSPLIRLPEMRRAIEQTLKDKLVLGAVTLDDSSTYSIILGSSFGMMQRHSDRLKTDSLAPKPGDHRDYRVCDSMAAALDQIKGIPDFQLYWPTKAKDDAIRAMLSFLDKNGDQVGDLLPTSNSWAKPPNPTSQSQF